MKKKVNTVQCKNKVNGIIIFVVDLRKSKINPVQTHFLEKNKKLIL